MHIISNCILNALCVNCMWRECMEIWDENWEMKTPTILRQKGSIVYILKKYNIVLSEKTMVRRHGTSNPLVEVLKQSRPFQFRNETDISIHSKVLLRTDWRMDGRWTCRTIFFYYKIEKVCSKYEKIEKNIEIEKNERVLQIHLI